MKPEFELKPNIGVGPIKLGVDRVEALDSMGQEPDSFMKTPMSIHPTDSFYEAGFQIAYGGVRPKVESIELSRGCGFEAIFSGVSIFNLLVPEVLSKIKEVTGYTPQTEDNGYTYEIAQLGLWLWRQSNELVDNGMYFSTIGVGTPST